MLPADRESPVVQGRMGFSAACVKLTQALDFRNSKFAK
jgi:hypothetical protein